MTPRTHHTPDPAAESPDTVLPIILKAVLEMKEQVGEIGGKVDALAGLADRVIVLEMRANDHHGHATRTEARHKSYWRLARDGFIASLGAGLLVTFESLKSHFHWGA